MRIIDLHCYPGTQTWIDSQGPYVEALAKYWSRGWVAKTEDEVLSEFTDAGVEACLVALDLETTVATPPCTNDYVHAMWKRHPQRIVQCWGTLDPFKGELAMREARHAMQEVGHAFGLHHCLDPRCAMYPQWTPSYPAGDASFCTFCRDQSEQKIRQTKS
jgi:hypothetical protein